MPSNNSGLKLRALAAQYPGQVGHLLNPDRWLTPFLPFAVDNLAYKAFKNSQPWDPTKFLNVLQRLQQRGHRPEWVLVPDVVGNRKATLQSWREWSRRLRNLYPTWPLAFAVQDDMKHRDVPKDATVVFIGGTTQWKRDNLEYWIKQFPRVHVGRINTRRWVWASAELGAESCDGTGWFMGDPKQLLGLELFLEEWNSGHRKRPKLPDESVTY